MHPFDLVDQEEVFVTFWMCVYQWTNSQGPASCTLMGGYLYDSEDAARYCGGVRAGCERDVRLVDVVPVKVSVKKLHPGDRIVTPQNCIAEFKEN